MLYYRDTGNVQFMTYTQLIEYFKTQSNAAISLGFSQQTISDWNRKKFSYANQCVVQVETKGKLKADPRDKK